MVELKPSTTYVFCGWVQRLLLLGIALATWPRRRFHLLSWSAALRQELCLALVGRISCLLKISAMLFTVMAQIFTCDQFSEIHPKPILQWYIFANLRTWMNFEYGVMPLSTTWLGAQRCTPRRFSMGGGCRDQQLLHSDAVPPWTCVITITRQQKEALVNALYLKHPKGNN